MALTAGSALSTLNAVGAEPGLDVQPSRERAWRCLRDEISRLCKQRNQLPVLIIDEARHLRSEVLEELRLLSNFEFESGQRLCLLLAGLSELRRRLSMSAHESLAQRLVIRHRLGALSRDEAGECLKHRLKVAGGAAVPRFGESAIEALFKGSGGIPRQLDRLSHCAMAAACRQQAAMVDIEHVKLAADEVLSS